MSTAYDLLYRGGVTKENSVRYLTAETPPTDDNSNKVPTTEWVQEKMDDVEAAVSGGMFPKVSTAQVSGRNVLVPSGGTWWVYYNDATLETNAAKPGGTLLYTAGSASDIAASIMCIKIA